MQGPSLALSEEIDSFKKRLFYKVVMGILTPLIGLVILAIVPRALGPAEYGVYTFLFSFFTAYVAFIESGTSTCFYAKLSAKTNDHHLLSFYLKLILLIVIFSFFLLILSYLLKANTLIWKNISFGLVVPMFFLGMFMWFNDLVLKACDAIGVTVQAETYRFIHRIFMLVFICGFSFFSFLTLKVFVYFQCIFFFLYAYFIWLRILLPKFKNLSFSFSITSHDKSFAKDFFSYSAPLFFSTAFFQISQMLESWVLTHYAGHTQQGYFGLAMQFSTMALVFTGAVLPLVFKEFSMAASQNDLNKMQFLFEKSAKQVPFLAMVLSVFLAFNGEQMAEIFAGREYKEANITLSLMLLYPIHQAYGQLCNVSFFAFGKTKIHMLLSVLAVLISLPLAFFLLLPQSQGGLFLGAFGQAVKYLAVQVVISNIALFFACKICHLKFLNLIFHQMASLCLMFFAGGVSKAVVGFFFGAPGHPFFVLINLFFSGCLYLLLVSSALLLFPSFIALKEDEMRKLKRKGVGYFKKYFKG